MNSLTIERPSMFLVRRSRALAPLAAATAADPLASSLRGWEDALDRAAGKRERVVLQMQRPRSLHSLEGRPLRVSMEAAPRNAPPRVPKDVVVPPWAQQGTPNPASAHPGVNNARRPRQLRLSTSLPKHRALKPQEMLILQLRRGDLQSLRKDDRSLRIPHPTADAGDLRGPRSPKVAAPDARERREESLHLPLGHVSGAGLQLLRPLLPEPWRVRVLHAHVRLASHLHLDGGGESKEASAAALKLGRRPRRKWDA